MIRVVIIDDHVVVRAGLRYIIEADPELEFAGEFGGGEGAAAIRSAMAGEVFMTDEVRGIYETRKGSKGLSAREAEALTIAARGSNNREIAAAMGLSENSVKMFLKRAFFKLGAANRAEAVQLAVSRGLIAAPN